MGFLSNIFAYPFRWIFYLVGQNYLLTLFLFAVLMKLILFPFGIKQQKNSLKQAKLRPREMAIRNKYKGRNDKATQQKLNEEIMKLYQEENFNPMSGCFPMLLQLPILFSLFYVITRPLTYILQLPKETVAALTKGVKSTYPEIIAASNISKGAAVDVEGVDVNAIIDLGKSFEPFGFDFSVRPQDEWGIYIIIPVLTFVFSFLSTKLIRKFTFQPQTNQDPSTKASMTMMDFMMPLLSVYISIICPAAIGIYWMFQNILSVLQQYILYKMYPIPAVTEAEIKEAELQLKGKNKNNNKNKTVVLSDDYYDDYDKTVETDKSSNKQKKKGEMAKRKGVINPKVLEMYKNGTRLKAKKKI